MDENLTAETETDGPVLRAYIVGLFRSFPQDTLPPLKAKEQRCVAQTSVDSGFLVGFSIFFMPLLVVLRGQLLVETICVARD